MFLLKNRSVRLINPILDQKKYDGEKNERVKVEVCKRKEELMRKNLKVTRSAYFM